MEMAVSRVCRKEGLNEQLSWVGSVEQCVLCPAQLQPPWDTHTAAADEYDEEGLQYTSCAHHPGQPQEKDDPKDILQAGKVHSHKGAHAGCLKGQEGKGHTASERSSYATGRSI